MNLKRNLEQLNINRTDYIYLLVLLIFSVLISVYLINFNLKLGIYCSDVFVYLSNSLNFAGVNVDASSTMYLSPVICFLTSLLFRIGISGEIAIYIVTACFGILGNIGLYVFLKNKFSPILSLTGAILFGSFTLNLLWWGNGSLDIPAVALSIWTIIFAIVAIDKNPKFYQLAFPLFVISVFTRYTTVFIFPLVLLYYFTKHDFFIYLDNLISDRMAFKSNFKAFFKSENCKYLIRGIILALIVVAILVIVILAFGSPLSFLTQTSTFASGSKGEIIDNAYTTDTFFYVHEFLNFLFANKISFDGNIPVISQPNVLSYLVIGILTIGLLIGFYRLIKRFRNTLESDGNNNLNFKTKHFASFLKVSVILCIVLGILSFKINSLFTNTFMLIALVILFSLLVNYFNRLDYSVTALALGWSLIYFIFFTFLNIKVNRYIIPALPGFIYFFVYALDFILKALFEEDDVKITENKSVEVHEKSDRAKKYSFKKIAKIIVPIILMIMFIFSAFSFENTVELTDDFNVPRDASEFLMNYDVNYVSHQVAVYNQRVFNWFLKTYTIPVSEDKVSFLESSNITYYISKHPVKLENYTEIYKLNNLHLYERI